VGALSVPQTEPEAEAERPFLTRAGAASLLGVSPNTVSRWAREGKLDCQLTLGGHRRFERSAIEALRRRLRARGSHTER
jgi:excisionase family DNA binding protein